MPRSLIRYLREEGRSGERPIPGAVEAREWLKRSGRNRLMTEHISFDRAPVEEAYASGAVQVFVVGVRRSTDQGAEFCGTLLLELPSDSPTRPSVFSWAQSIAGPLGLAVERDTGQSHLLVMLD
jgi:hypothetical protein